MIDPKLIDEADPIGSVFTPVMGLPGWNVQKGHGSFLTFDFGAPYLSIREPIADPKTTDPRVRKRLQRRRVIPHGEYYLWIYCCHWRCAENGVEVANDAANDVEITAAARFMDGQILSSVKVDPISSRSYFRFDLGATLETWPYEDEDNNEQWMLYTPLRHVFSLRADRYYSWSPNDCPSGREVWTVLP